MGVAKDAHPLDVGEMWTDVNNMRFNDGAAEKFGGVTQGAVTPEQAIHLQFNGDHASPLWVYMTDGGIRASDFTTDYDLDDLNTVSSSSNWNSVLFNGIPVMNNTVDAPWYWDGNLSNDVLPLPAFPANTLCQCIHEFRSFLIALNITDTGNIQENRLIWSDSSDAGALPASWDIADPTTLAGDAYLTDSKGEIIDGLQLRDLFVIYKTHSTYIMRLVGGQSVMRVDKIHINSGILAKNCVQEFKGKHFVVSDADVVLFDGQNIQSIADKRVRSEIFNNIDVTNYRNTYTARYDRNDEMWICYPTTGQTYPNKAAIWNWKDDTWTFRELNNARHIASGIANFTPGPTWDSQAVTWDSQAITWNPISNNPTIDTLVSASDLRLGIIDDSYDNYGVAMPSLLEKTTMDLDQEDYVKVIKSITPRITAEAGTEVFISVGTQMHPDDSIVWGNEQLYTVGIDREVLFSQKGRYISVRLRTQGANLYWQFHGLTFKAALSGKY